MHPPAQMCPSPGRYPLPWTRRGRRPRASDRRISRLRLSSWSQREVSIQSSRPFLDSERTCLQATLPSTRIWCRRSAGCRQREGLCVWRSVMRPSRQQNQTTGDVGRNDARMIHALCFCRQTAPCRVASGDRPLHFGSLPPTGPHRNAE